MILASAATGSIFSMVSWMVIIFAIFYFMMIKPQQKEQNQKNAMLAELALGDTVLTSSGFYGVIIDIDEDTVIVEFGSNRNCRIPMQKTAIVALEKPGDSNKEPEEKDDKKKK